MSQLKISSYLTALELNKTAVFEWNIFEDELNFDEMMKFVLTHEIPKKNAKKNLSDARLIHPKDRQEFKNHVNRMLTMKTMRTAPTQNYFLDCRIYTTDGHYVWFRFSYRAYFNDGIAFRVVGSVANVDSLHQEQIRLKNEIIGYVNSHIYCISVYIFLT